MVWRTWNTRRVRSVASTSTVSVPGYDARAAMPGGLVAVAGGACASSAVTGHSATATADSRTVARNGRGIEGSPGGLSTIQRSVAADATRADFAEGGVAYSSPEARGAAACEGAARGVRGAALRLEVWITRPI